MSTSTGILTEALEYLGEPPATGNEAHGHAFELKRMLPREARTMLEAHPWNFASEKQQLSASDPKPVDFDYGYQKPSSWVRTIKADTQADMRHRNGVFFEDRQGRLLCNSDTFWLWFVSSKVLDTWGAWPQLTKEALAARMALKRAPHTSMSNAEKAALRTEAKNLMYRAQLHDSQQSPDHPTPMSIWQQSRFGGGRNGWGRIR